MKLYSARASLHTALQSPTTVKYIKADDPDLKRVSRKLPKTSTKGKVAKALLAQTGSF